MRHSLFRPRLLAAALAAALSASAGAATPAPAQPPMLLAVENGLVQENAVEINNAAQALAETLGKAAGRKVLWQARYAHPGRAAAPQPGAAADFAFVKPPNQTAQMLAKGWQLLAVARAPVEFGVDFIAQPCPGKPGQVLLGGPTLTTLGIDSPTAACMPPAQVWNSPAAVLLTPGEGSLVDRVAGKLWLQHAPKLPATVHVAYQNAVTGFMQTTQAAVIGAVTPLVSKAWAAHGGVVLAHQAMPFWALLGAPGMPAPVAQKVRAALTDGNAAALNRALGVEGWDPGNPQTYADFARWLGAR